MRLPILALLGLSLLGCRSSNNNTTTDAPNNGIDTPGSGAQTIQDVQNDATPVGTAVSLHGVIVTAIDAHGVKTGDIYVEEPGGGAFSGVHVFGAPTSQVAALAVGDIVDILGAEKDEFVFGTPPVGDTRTVTELKGAAGGMMTVTKTGTGTVPAPMVVDALAIGQMADPTARWAEWEKWEGVLITVKNVSALSSSKCVGSMCTDPTLTSFKITGDALIESALTDGVGGVDLTMAKSGDCLDTVTGVVDWFFDYQILPRSAADLLGSGAGCPVAEVACTDGTDNDGNGFGDCADNNCIVTAGTCRPMTSISAIRATTPTGGVELDNVFVTAVAANKKSFWVSNALVAASGEGVYVFSNATIDSSVVVGAKINIIGKVSEFKNPSTSTDAITEVQLLAVTAATGGSTVPVTGKTLAQLVAAGEQYESVLVTLTNVRLTQIPDPTMTTGNHGVGKLTDGTTTIETDDDISKTFQTGAAVNDCFATVTGIWSWQGFDSSMDILPISATPNGVCSF